ncbi:MAG TPA: molybdopterin molybdenumtransferase MoeA, partial [Campylobacterales bacterium]|nr:molybdopterin molybdenumtransferase MoeA [Campylobacterales bacterium]
ESFEPLKNQKPGMVSPLDKADGMIVTAPEVDTLNKHQEVKMIPIKLNTERDTKEDFLIRM